MSNLTLSYFRRLAPSLYRTKIPVVLAGPPGVGKSALIEAVARDLNARVAMLLGSAATVTTISGYAVPSGSSPVVTTHAMPPWFLTRAIDDPSAPILPMSDVPLDTPVILHIEEYGQMDPDARRILGELLHARRVGEWALPPNAWVIACTNRYSDRSGVKRDFDFLINRTIRFDLQPDARDLIDYFEGKGYAPLFCAFIDRNPELVFSEAPEAQGPWMTPRSLEACARYVEAVGGLESALSASGDMLTVFCGLVGEAAAHKLVAWLKLANSLPKPSDIIRDPNTAPVPDKLDQCAAVAFALARFVTRPTLKPVVTYMRRLPADFAVPFIMAVVARRANPQQRSEVAAMLVDPAISGWISDNSALLSAVSKYRQE